MNTYKKLLQINKKKPKRSQKKKKSENIQIQTITYKKGNPNDL